MEVSATEVSEGCAGSPAEIGTRSFGLGTLVLNQISATSYQILFVSGEIEIRGKIFSFRTGALIVISAETVPATVRG